MVAAWVLIPGLVALAAAALGAGVAQLSGQRLGPLTLPTGFVAGVAVAGTCLHVGLNGNVTALVLALLSLAGAVAHVLRLMRPLRLRRPPRETLYALGAATAAYAVGLAPLAGSGRLGILGYALNNDSAAHIAAIEILRDHGTSMFETSASSFDWVGTLTASGYPVGSYAWFLFASAGTGVDQFNLWTPLTALAGAMTAIVAFSLLRELMPAIWAAVAGTVVAWGYLPFSYLAQGGAKEVLIALTVYTTVALFVRSVRDGYGPRTGIPVGIGIAAAVANIGLGGLAWLGPPAVVAVAVMLLRPTGRITRARTLVTSAVGAAVAVALITPALVEALSFVRGNETALSNPAQIGNLLGPVPWIEAFNVWLHADYRYPNPTERTATYLGLALAAALAAAGLLHALLRGAWGVALAVLAGASGAIIVSSRYAIYFDAKTYMALAPSLAMATAAGVAWLYRSSVRNQGLAIAAGVLLVAAVARSDFMVYQGVRVTPEQRFEELASLGERYAGQGPMLVNERDDYAKYILREVRPYNSWEVWTPNRGIIEKDGYNPRLDTPHTPDFDDYVPSFVQTFPLLLERKRPGGSRPPSNFEAVDETAHYRVWRRSGTPPLDHLPLGARDVSGATALDCRAPEVADFLRRARDERRAVLAALPGPAPVVVTPGQWTNFEVIEPGPTEEYLVQRGGHAGARPHLRPGRYDIFLKGSFGTGNRVSVEGRPTGEVFGDLGLFDAWHPVGRATVGAGVTQVDVFGLTKPRWQSGSKRANITGQLAFDERGSSQRYVRLPPGRARALCNRRVDWVEALGRAVEVAD